MTSQRPCLLLCVLLMDIAGSASSYCLIVTDPWTAFDHPVCHLPYRLSDYVSACRLVTSLCIFCCQPLPSAQDLYAAVGEQILLPMETVLDHVGGDLCNKLRWIYQKSADQYLEHVTERDGYCRRKDCARSRCSLTSNGSLHLHHLTTEDSGTYTLLTYLLSGNLNTRKSYQLHVLDPVSVPAVTVQCLSDDRLLVSCDAESRSDPQILLTVNGETLRGTNVTQVNVTTSLSPPWNITCSASNQVSWEVTYLSYRSCADPGEELGVIESIVKVVLFVMYNALLVRGILGMKTSANQ